MSNFAITDLQQVLVKVLVQNLVHRILRSVIQKIIDIIYFDWCLIRIMQTFIEYMFLSRKILLIFFEDFAFKIIYFPKVVLRPQLVWIFKFAKSGAGIYSRYAIAKFVSVITPQEDL